MPFTRKIRPDRNLKQFMNYCENKFKDNLFAIIIYGSYAWGYFDKEKSDYDIIVILKNKTKINKKEIEKIFPKLSLQYLMSKKEILNYTHLGHFTTYITLLKSGRTLYVKRGYKRFLRKLRKTNLLERTFDAVAIAAKTTKEIKQLESVRGYNGLKWALPAIRKRIQLLTYIRFKKLIWNLRLNLWKNRDIFTKQERRFIIQLNKGLRSRSNDFPKRKKTQAIAILRKLRSELITNLTELLK
jgi:predicted nucleotidyltransferase